jgi:hypothetical protein
MQVAHFSVGGQSFSGQLIKKGHHTFRVGWPAESVPEALATRARPSDTRSGISTIKLTIDCLVKVDRSGPGGEDVLTPDTPLS